MEQQVLEMAKDGGFMGYALAVVVGVVWVLREVKGLVPQNKRDSTSSIFKTQTKVTSIAERLDDVQKQISDMERQIQDLHDWHAKEDENGVKLWYNKPAIERMITNMENSTNDLNREMGDLCTSLKEFISRLREG